MELHRILRCISLGGDVGTSGVENGADRDSMLVTDNAEQADKENRIQCRHKNVDFIIINRGGRIFSTK
eukprot:scaffold27251_cov55-Attheya_sp.AAC.1